MRIAVMAAGAVGGYFGARLAAAGHEVHFIARGRHLDALRTNGLKVESTHGNLHLKSVDVTDDPTQVGAVDIVLFAVKLWDTEKAAEETRPLLGPNTRLITLQNGVDSFERIAPIVGADVTVPGTAQIATVIAAPGVIRHTSAFARIRCGRVDRRADPELESFVAQAKEAGLDIAIPPDIQVERWEKFVFLVGLSGITASNRKPIGPLRADPATRRHFFDIMQEVVTIARAKGIGLAPDFAEMRMQFVDNIDPGMKASMLHDLEAGNRLELDWLAGKVIALGRELGIPTPANERVYATLAPYRMGKRA